MKLNTAFAALFALHGNLVAAGLVPPEHGNALVPRDMDRCSTMVAPTNRFKVQQPQRIKWYRQDDGSWYAQYWVRNEAGQEQDVIYWTVTKDATEADPDGWAVTVKSDIVSKEGLISFFQFDTELHVATRVPQKEKPTDSPNFCKYHLRPEDRKPGDRPSEFLSDIVTWTDFATGA